MAAILTVIAFLALMAWRFVFAGLHRRLLFREIAAPQQQYDNVLEQRLPIPEQPCAGIIAENRFDVGSDETYLIDGKSRARTYLRRIVALTGATQMDNRYVLDVGKTRFHVRDRHVRRLRDSTNPECGYDETCFCPVHNGMPKAEEIATVLLHLKNNPALFDKWAAQNGLAFKAGGQVFTRAQ